LKLYNTDIYLDGNHESLRTGMTCKAEIVIDHYKTATYIPVQAVLRVGGKPTVYVVKDKTLEARSVDIGLDNSRMVRILKGLNPGETVSLSPPLAAAEVKMETETFTEIIPEKAVEKTGSAPVNDVTAERQTGLQKQAQDERSVKASAKKKKKKDNGKAREDRRKQREQMMKRLPPEEQERVRNMSREERREFWRQMQQQKP
ncbi:hypothetical protein ACFL0M_12330, partial [Thermodesulfobacteriota bacterium]